MRINYTIKPDPTPTWDTFKDGDYFIAVGAVHGDARVLRKNSEGLIDTNSGKFFWNNNICSWDKDKIE